MRRARDKYRGEWGYGRVDIQSGTGAGASGGGATAGGRREKGEGKRPLLTGRKEAINAKTARRLHRPNKGTRIWHDAMPRGGGGDTERSGRGVQAASHRSHMASRTRLGSESGTARTRRKASLPVEVEAVQPLSRG